MEYRLRIEDETISVEASRLDQSGAAAVTVAGETRNVVVKAVSANHLHLAVNGTAREVFAATAEGGTWIWVAGRPRFVEDADKAPRRKSRGPGETTREVTPPTPAAVIRVMVQVGDKVAKGQGLVVVTAMKMEITLSAPYSGTVTAVNCEAGAQVMPGQILVEIDPDPEEDQNG